MFTNFKESFSLSREMFTNSHERKALSEQVDVNKLQKASLVTVTIIWPLEWMMGRKKSNNPNSTETCIRDWTYLCVRRGDGLRTVFTLPSILNISCILAHLYPLSKDIG